MRSPVEPDAMRVACPCSMEARQSNPDDSICLCIAGRWLRVILTFYPIAFVFGMRAMRKISALSSRQSRHVSKLVSGIAADAPKGFVTFLGKVRSTCADVGSCCVATDKTGREFASGDESKKLTANSSTIKGP